jgi:TRAP-type uncharacterized transport system substrate-binding protein
MAARDVLRHHWPMITIALTAGAIACAAVAMLGSMPPRTIVMATGPDGEAYKEIGERYRAALAREHVDVKLRPTAGGVENLALLLDKSSGVDVALVPAGIVAAADATRLESLGTLFYEPFWWFHRRDVEGIGAGSLRGRRVAIGAQGSGTYALSLDLLKRNGNEGQLKEALMLPPRATAEKLLSGDIDIAFMMTSWDAPVVQQLLADERIALSGYPRADAFVAIYPFMSKLIVPRGVRDLAKDLPPTDITMIGSKASLVARKDLHPALQYLLLEAAVEIHGGPGIFQRANQFPAAEQIDIPLSGEARQFFRSGPPFLQSYLPFWLATLIGKLIILLIPIVGVLYPMTQLLPRLYDWVMRSKILRMYGELRLLEDEVARARTNDTGDMLARLDRLEEQANRVKMPVAYASMLYGLRDHIALVRDGLRTRAAAQ